MKRVLITGANSYIGDNVKTYLEQAGGYTVDIVDTIGFDPYPDFFSPYDVVFNVAGIAHIKETSDNRHLYYEINRDLVVKIAKAAKEAGVAQFVLLSSMAVYGITTGHITKDTLPNPTTAYGESKLQADVEIRKLQSGSFTFSCIRPPMVYGKGCKGNYQQLRSFALKTPFFPSINNKRSMIYIGNLCECIKEVIDNKQGGVIFPQNSEYVRTSDMVALIARINEKKLVLIKVPRWTIKLFPIDTVKKVFGELTYEQTDVIDLYGFEESINLTEK